MDNEKIEFPKYEPKDCEKPDINAPFYQRQSYYKEILENWKEYLNSIPDTIFNKSMSGIIKNILYYISSLSKKEKIQLFEKAINDINSNLKLLKKCHDDDDEVSFSNHLINILSTIITVNNFHMNDELEAQYPEIKSKIYFVFNNLEKSQELFKEAKNILKAANQKGLAGEFDYQYRKYNKERIIWLCILLSTFLMILSGIFDFNIFYVDSNAVTMYLSFLSFIILFLNDTLLDDIKNEILDKLKKIYSYIINIIKKVKNKFDEQKNTSQKDDTKSDKHENIFKKEDIKSLTISSIYTTMGQIISLFTGLYCFLGYYSDKKLSSLQLFTVSLIGKNYKTWQDLVPHLFIFIPMIWLLWFSIKQYHYTTKLMDAYRFKMALSLAYNGYKDQCLDSEHKDHLLHDVLSVIAEDPTKRDFKDTHMPWSEFKEYLNITEKLVNKNNSNKQS